MKNPEQKPAVVGLRIEIEEDVFKRIKEVDFVNIRAKLDDKYKFDSIQETKNAIKFSNGSSVGRVYINKSSIGIDLFINSKLKFTDELEFILKTLYISNECNDNLEIKEIILMSLFSDGSHELFIEKTANIFNGKNIIGEINLVDITISTVIKEKAINLNLGVDENNYAIARMKERTQVNFKNIGELMTNESNFLIEVIDAILT
ncbi:hypothetical protein SAMN04488134_102130 [Amphibacillus marinus]|uniref:Uncharacterized protein n=1 Tax=Amphibacillus marinus TaxID=872970 RepID=A0A1H8K151_9BACI|nr:hypothetical protein [Amphibacillus marinus]SEN86535.1 hypothetical protein SAMN04488134_102130 [Amphibacillus marinus]